jgi:phospholipase A1
MPFRLIVLFLLGCQTLAAAQSQTRDGESQLRLEGSGLTLYKENYILPYTRSSADNSAQDAEFKMQFSIKQQIRDWPVYAGFTYKAFWRMYDQDNSRPFRESNYNPEVFYWYDAKRGDFGYWGFYAGYEHESNGQKGLDSRSWDRIYFKPYYERDHYRIEWKVWYRRPERAARFPGDPLGDENPNIEDYYGHSEVHFRYQWDNLHMLSGMVRFNARRGRRGVELNYTWPTGSRRLFWAFQVWSGYGESLIDYDRRFTRVGIGVMFKR